MLWLVFHFHSVLLIFCKLVADIDIVCGRYGACCGRYGLWPISSFPAESTQFIGIVLIPSYKIFGLLNNKLTKTANFQDPWYLNVKLL